MSDFNGDDWFRSVSKMVAVSASASPFADGLCRAVYLGTAGDVTFTTLEGDSVTLPNLVAGMWHPIAATHITALANGAADAIIGY